MNIQDLKQAGKNLFKKNYWHSVLIAFLIALGENTGFSFSTNSSNSSTLEGVDLSAVNEFIFSPPVITALTTSVTVLTILSIFVFSSLRCGSIRYFLKARKNQSVDLGEAVQNFRDKTFLNIAKVTFFKKLFITLWTCLLIIPGIIKMFEYWAIDYILAVRPDIDRKEAHRLSKILMNGNKWDCFVLGFSFIGWSILSLLTLGILGIFYVNPYMQATYVEFFCDIRNQALAKGLITPADIPDYEFIHPQTQYQQQSYQQPQNVVYRPDGMPMENMGYTHQPFQHPQNYVYKPDGTPINSTFYTQSVQQPNQQPVSQPTEPVEKTHTQETNPE